MFGRSKSVESEDQSAVKPSQAEMPEMVGNGALPNTEPVLGQDGTQAQTSSPRVSPVTRFGEIVSLMMRSKGYKHYSLSDLEWLAVPPLMLNQFVLLEAQNKKSGISAPISLVFWAQVSDDVDERLSADPKGPMRLRPDEWNSGDNYWLVAALGDSKLIGDMIGSLQTQIFKGRSFKMKRVNKEGTVEVAVINDMNGGQGDEQHQTA